MGDCCYLLALVAEFLERKQRRASSELTCHDREASSCCGGWRCIRLALEADLMPGGQVKGAPAEAVRED